MSGMGKTVATTRLASALGADRTVIALDTTGEYGSRLGFPTWTPKDFITHGHFVYEPQGVPPSKAAEFISQAMRAGFEEYSAGDTPQPRTVILEEAHTFLPEFPMVLREQQKFVSESTRFVMQARKFGLTFVIVSQRTAVVSKSALSQCENYVILKTLDKTSLEYFESLVGPEMRGAIPGLNRFEAVCVGPAFNVDEPVIVHLEPGDR
jgi:DNA helicase HerA-like ATPase